MLRVSRLLAQAGLVDAFWFSEESRNRGHIVHAIGEAILLKQPIDVSPSYSGYRKALTLGLTALQFQPVCVERRLSADGVTGRPDTCGWLEARIGSTMYAGPAIVDIKSGERMPAHGIQLALYDSLANTYPDLRAALPAEYRGLPWQRIGLYVQPTGRYRLHPYLDDNDRLIAQSLLDLTRWKIANGLLNPTDVSLQDDDPTFLEEYGRRTLDGSGSEQSPTGRVSQSGS